MPIVRFALLTALLVGNASGKDVSITISHGGLTRTAILHTYASYKAAHAPPLIINWHMLGGGAAYQSIYTGDQSTGATFSSMADEHRMLVLYPQGYGNSWNAGACCAPAGAGGGVDDIGFARALLAHVVSLGYAYDASNVFSTGMSNGADMSYRLLCEASDLVRAIAPVAGVIGNVKNWLQSGAPDADDQSLYFPCADVTHAVPVLHIHGENDQLCRYDGQTGFRRSVASTFDILRSLTGNQAKFVQTLAVGSTLCESAISSGHNLTLCHTASGECSGHDWPGGRADYGGTYVCAPGLHASRQILRFFSEQAARGVVRVDRADAMSPTARRRQAESVSTAPLDAVKAQTEGEVRYQLSLVMRADVLPVDAVNTPCDSRGYASTALSVCQPRMHLLSSEEGGTMRAEPTPPLVESWPSSRFNGARGGDGASSALVDSLVPSGASTPPSWLAAAGIAFVFGWLCGRREERPPAAAPVAAPACATTHLK